MAYSEDYRKRVIEYRKEGHTLIQTREVFKVAIITIRKWEMKLEEEGTLKKKPVKRSFRKLGLKKSDYISLTIQTHTYERQRKNLAVVKRQ